MSRSALVAGIAQRLADAGLGDWDPDAEYDDNYAGWPILRGRVPQAPSKVIVLTAYTISDDATENDSIIGVQIRLRGDEDIATVQDRSDLIFGVLQGLHDETLNGVPIVLIERKSSAPLGQDENDRWQESCNYYVRVAWPTTYRTD